jgi:hypothetical protein
VLNGRDKLISWLLANALIELPYDRELLRSAIHNESLDTDSRRRACYAVLKNYDRAAEMRNVERVSRYVRDEMVPIEFPLPVLLAGRESRAFGNQAFLMASSTVVECSQGVRDAVARLEKLAAGEEFEKQLKSLISRQPSLIKQVLSSPRAAIRFAHGLTPSPWTPSPCSWWAC